MATVQDRLKQIAYLSESEYKRFEQAYAEITPLGVLLATNLYSLERFGEIPMEPVSVTELPPLYVKLGWEITRTPKNLDQVLGLLKLIAGIRDDVLDALKKAGLKEEGQ